MSQDPLNPELAAVEAALDRLTPARSRLDRDRLMFEAGVASVRSRSRGAWVWPSIAAGLAVVAISESIVLSRRPEPRVLVVRQEEAPSQDAVAGPDSVPIHILVEARPSSEVRDRTNDVGGGKGLDLRRQVLRFGLEGLPDPPLLTQSGGSGPAPGSLPETSGPLRRYELNKVLDLGGPS
jgi:hypothetical protein